MANKNNVIELNGKRYDASTGAFLGDSKLTRKSASPRPRMVDNFVKSPVLATAVAHPKKVSKSRPHVAAANTVKRQPQSSQTLMRTSVNKPSALSHASVKAHGATHKAAVAAPTVSSLRKLSSGSVDPVRQTRAQQLRKSTFIRHFSPDVAVPSMTQKDSVPTAKHHAYAAHVATPKAISHHKLQPSQQLFETALAQASSHEQTYRKPRHPKRRKYVGFASGALAALLIAGFVAYINIPNLTMSFASTKAGFHASLPGYQPAGFSVGRFVYSAGSVAVNFKSHSDNRNYSIVQKVSSWDTQALYANYVALTKQPYQTYQNAGRTVYLYGDNNATWVDGGVWYTVQGNDSLSSHQLLEMADSM